MDPYEGPHPLSPGDTVVLLGIIAILFLLAIRNDLREAEDLTNSRTYHYSSYDHSPEPYRIPSSPTYDTYPRQTDFYPNEPIPVPSAPVIVPFLSKTTPARVDLHGLIIPDALAVAGAHLRRCRRAGQKKTMFITGWGRRSVDGRAKLKPAIEAWLGGEKGVRIIYQGNRGVVVAELERVEHARYVKLLGDINDY